MGVTKKQLDLYNTVILENLKERFSYLEQATIDTSRNIADLTEKVKGSRKPTLKPGISQEEFEALLQIRHEMARERKNIKRARGALLQNKPEVYRTIILKIVRDQLSAEDISKAIKNFQGQSPRTGGIGHYFDKVTGKVGHTPVGLNILPNALEDWLQPFDKATSKKNLDKFLKLARDSKLDVGDEFLNFIDPAAHKPFNKIVTGVLAKRFGLNPKDIPQDFLQDLYKKQAHAALFGGTAGFEMPVVPDLKGVAPEDFFKAAKPFLVLPYMSNTVASQLENVLMNSDNLSTADLQKAINNIEIPKEATKLAEELNILRDPNAKGRLLYDASQEKIIAGSPVSGPVSNLKDTLLFNRSKITRGAAWTAMVKGITSIPKVAAQTVVNYADTAIPSKKSADLLKNPETRDQGWGEYKKELLSTGITTGLLKTASMIPQIGGGLSKLGPLAAHPLTWIVGGVTALKRLDDNIFESKGQEALESSSHSYLNPLLGAENVEEGRKKFDEDARRHADEGGWDVSGYSF